MVEAVGKCVGRDEMTPLLGDVEICLCEIAALLFVRPALFVHCLCSFCESGDIVIIRYHLVEMRTTIYMHLSCDN